jgi:hypothetical protein
LPEVAAALDVGGSLVAGAETAADDLSETSDEPGSANATEHAKDNMPAAKLPTTFGEHAKPAALPRILSTLMTTSCLHQLLH